MSSIVRCNKNQRGSVVADLNAKPKRVARASKTAGVAVPFMPEAQPAAAAADDKPVSALIEEIVHLPIDVAATSNPESAPASAAVADQPSEQSTAATTAPTEHEDDTMNETIENAAQTMQQNTQDAMSKGKQTFEEMTAFGQGNVEAMVESARVAVKGVEAMAQARAAFAKQSFEATVATLKSMAEVRTPTDFFKVQGDYLRSSMDALVAETSRSTEATLKLVGEIAQPIQNRVALAAEKVRTAA